MPRKQNESTAIKNEHLIDDAMKAEIRKKARAEILAAKKAEAAKQLLAQYKAEELTELEPEQETVDLVIDIPGYSNYMMIDGRTFTQGEKITVTKQEAASILCDMQNAWRHERSNGGAHMKEYMAPAHDSLSAIHGSSHHKLNRV